MKQLYEIVNQLSTLENKLRSNDEFERCFSRCRQALQELEITYYSPLNEVYRDTRTDVEAHITGNPGPNMVISQVIKPVIVHKGALVQRGIVIVETK